MYCFRLFELKTFFTIIVHNIQQANVGIALDIQLLVVQLILIGTTYTEGYAEVNIPRILNRMSYNSLPGTHPNFCRKSHRAPSLTKLPLVAKLQVHFLVSNRRKYFKI